MSDAHDAFNPAIAGYYNRGKEAQRLHKGKSQLEHLCTQELLLRSPPPAPLSYSACPTPHRFTSNRRRRCRHCNPVRPSRP